MRQFVGAEYVIANLLIRKKKAGQNYVSMEELILCGVKVQRILKKNSIDAIFLTTRDEFYEAIYDFSDFFSCEFDDITGRIKQVEIKDGKNIKDLEDRFVGYIPEEIVKIIEEASNETNVA